MKRPETNGWEVTTNENGIKMATLPRDTMEEILKYVEYVDKQLRIHDVVGQSEQLICDTCKSGLIDYPDINRRTCRCGGLGYNVTD